MKTIKIVLVLIGIVTLSIAFSSCENPVINNIQNTPDNFQISAFDYSDLHYFVDTLYKRSFTEYYNDSASSYVYENKIDLSNNKFEAWVECDINHPAKRLCVGKIMLGARPPQGYDTSITNPGIIIDNKFTGYFRKLEANEYNINPFAGFIGITINIPFHYTVGVVYRTVSNSIFGKGSNESNVSDTLILKLVNFRTPPDPVSTPISWNLQMKNVYKIPYTNIIAFSSFNVKFLVDILYRDTIPGINIPLITMLKLDKFNNVSLLPPPDGKFDWLTGKTIFPDAGYLVFPVLEPFSKGIKDYGLDSNYVYWEIYSQSKAWIQASPKANLYVIKGNAVY